MPIKIFIVDDVRENAEYVKRVLSDYDTEIFTDPNTALEHCKENRFDILVTDQKMPVMNGIDLVRATRKITDDFLAIVISAYTDSEDLIDAVNSNLVYKYLVKPVSPNVLLQHVLRACERLELVRTNSDLQEQIRVQNRLLVEENRLLKAGKQPIFDVFTGSDPAMNRVKELTQLYAAGTQPVLISGETGTGKELLARVVHTFSARRDKPFLPVNCAALQQGLLESELFGYEAGAFTGAAHPKKGLLELADGGVLFLDEIGELPLSLQPKLLRVLQFGTFIPLGAIKERHVDVRLISATNKNLRTEVQRGTFREDLYHRVSAFQIRLPPLRHRRKDIVPILERIAEARGIFLPEFTPDAMQRLHEYDYPGNVRELQNVLERLVAMSRLTQEPFADDDLVKAAIYPDGESEVTTNVEVAADTVPSIKTLAEELLSVDHSESINLTERIGRLQRFIITNIYEQEAGNISRTARRVGMSRPGIRSKLREYGYITGEHTGDNRRN